jgi:outer membrane protein OmpA-like peptidoglycan-associated protein
MKRILYIATAVMLSISAFSQDFLGYANSNYAGVNGIDLNPASIADSRYKVDIVLFGTNFMAGNNWTGMNTAALKYEGKLTNPSSLKFPAFDDTLFTDKYLIRKTDDQARSVFLSNRIMLPSFMVTLNDKSAFALTGSIRTYVNVDGVENPMANLIYSDFGDSTLYQSFTNKRLSVQYMTWAEIGGTYAMTVIDNKEHFLKVGVRPKLLLGLGSAFFFANDLQYLTVNDSQLTFIKTDVQYSHSNNFEFSEGGFKYKIDSKPGFGLDLGAVYEWRPNYQKFKYDMDGETDLWMRYKNKYKLRVGASITDIGSIKFERGQFSNNFVAEVNQWNFRDVKLDSIPIRALDDTLRNRFAALPTDQFYRMNLPTAFSVQVDYHIWDNFYLNFTSFLAVQWNNNPNKVHDLTTFSLTPRYDWKWAGIWVPMSYNQFRNFQTGAGIRLGPIVIGTNNLAPWFSKKKTIYGADLHVALKIPIMYRPTKDKDKDKVSDKRDKCKEVPGVWEFLGCPDRDGDHVQDSEDICPDEPGLKQFNGCPDRDSDGVMDKQDACPDDKGLPEFNGCPDKDGDKIIDKEDDCPEEAGLLEFKGCPDRDGDGVMDKVDLCPDKPGPVDNEGCPEIKLHLVDLAGQSLKSTKQAKDGSFTYESLPSDSVCVFRLDGDNTEGVNEVKVVVNGANKRALRSQVDRLFRFDIPKPAGNGLQKVEIKDVAVVLTKEEQEIVKKAFDNLEFQSGKDIIQPGSLASLDELADLLKKHPTWKLRITGHTDNVGKPAANMKLSEKRAKAVQKYLVSKGVAADRFYVEWYGPNRPVAPNTTPEGRQKNRRVEMLIVE